MTRPPQFGRLAWRILVSWAAVFLVLGPAGGLAAAEFLRIPAARAYFESAFGALSGWDALVFFVVLFAAIPGSLPALFVWLIAAATAPGWVARNRIAAAAIAPAVGAVAALALWPLVDAALGAGLDSDAAPTIALMVFALSLPGAALFALLTRPTGAAARGR